MYLPVILTTPKTRITEILWMSGTLNARRYTPYNDLLWNRAMPGAVIL